MNKTIKVIDLLNKIANGEEVPKKIHFKYSTYQFDKIDEVYRNINGNHHLEQDYMISNKLNDEVEIIEDNDKLENNFNYIYQSEDEKVNANFENIKTTLKDIVDHINKIEEEIRK